jgi:hypothetical protein
MSGKKIFSILLVLAFLGLGVFIYFKYYFVFATGTKAGNLNTFQRKGVIFKTYEGKIIQSGFRANVQSNEFSFSVTDQKVAEELLKLSGKEVQLHYKLYNGSLPWRGMQRFIVDSVYAVWDASSIQERVISPK